jgi:hypothetical protein
VSELRFNLSVVSFHSSNHFAFPPSLPVPLKSSEFCHQSSKSRLILINPFLLTNLKMDKDTKIAIIGAGKSILPSFSRQLYG